MQSIPFNIAGLNNDEVKLARKKYGRNVISHKQESGFLYAIKSLVKEPMVILLLLAAVIYFISGKTADAVFLAVAIVLVAAISLYQDTRSRSALEKLKQFSQPKCKVIRNGAVEEINTDEVVAGDSLMVEEGTMIPADGNIVHSNDFSVNESILTGESYAVEKDKSSEDHFIYKGTTVAGGLAIATVTAIGNESRIGKIGGKLEDIRKEKTPLEIQISSFVSKMVIAGAIIFAIVWAINYYNTDNALDSLLKALTLAMSILPEEIPVAFTTFMALGAWRLTKMGIVVKQMKTVETLGSATVICIDKTGTITENKMQPVKLFTAETGATSPMSDTLDKQQRELIRTAMWASEPIPFDPMETALHETYAKNFTFDERSEYRMRHEYPLAGKPPMMTHIFEDKSGNRIIAAKGAPEAIMNVAGLAGIERQQAEDAISEMAADGYRVLGVGEAHFTSDTFPKTQQEIKFQFKGIIAFYDPPRQNIEQVLQDFYKAGIEVKIVTGDNAITTAAIANQIGFRGNDHCISGDEIMKLSGTALQKAVHNNFIFTRVFPEAKLKVIEALKQTGEVVAMTGDGVNDGPALKAAHIGIAMGKKGTELAKEAASLVLVDDELSRMVDAVAMGRKIYANLKKAIQYVISIHIPIVLTVFLPLVLGWLYPNIFSPVHIIFMELIMGPTCSIIYENEPMEPNTMFHKPRSFTTTFFKWNELATSILQGLMITAGTLLMYQYAVHHHLNEKQTRTMVFAVLIGANIFLTLVNRSFFYSVITTFRYKNNLVLLIITVTVLVAMLIIYLKPLADFFEFEKLSPALLFISTGTGFLSVVWYEAVKWWKRSRGKRQDFIAEKMVSGHA